VRCDGILGSGRGLLRGKAERAKVPPRTFTLPAPLRAALVHQAITTPTLIISLATPPRNNFIAKATAHESLEEFSVELLSLALQINPQASLARKRLKYKLQLVSPWRAQNYNWFLLGGPKKVGPAPFSPPPPRNLEMNMKICPHKTAPETATWSPKSFKPEVPPYRCRYSE